MDVHLFASARDLQKLGWRVCPSSSEHKHPPYSGWHQLATTDETRLQGLFARYPECDAISVQWGPLSGVIDLDFDEEESYERFREKYLLPDSLNGLRGEVVPPCFRSGRRGTPHLVFRFNERLPEKANVSCRGVGFEIDAKLGWNNLGSQSLVPPSPRYAWEIGRAPWEIDVPELPPLAIDLLLRASRLSGTRTTVVSVPSPNGNGSHTVAVPAEAARIAAEGGYSLNDFEQLLGSRTTQEWVEISNGANEGDRHNACLSWVGREARAMKPLKKGKLIDLAIEFAEKCRPPLDPVEAEKIACDVHSMELRRRQSEGAREAQNRRWGGDEGRRERQRDEALKSLQAMGEDPERDIDSLIRLGLERHAEVPDHTGGWGWAVMDQISRYVAPLSLATLRWIAEKIAAAGLPAPDRLAERAFAERRNAALVGVREGWLDVQQEEAVRGIQHLISPPAAEGDPEDQGGEENAGDGPGEAPVGAGGGGGGGGGGGRLRLERIECASDPVEWRLYAPGLFDRCPLGYVAFSTESLSLWGRAKLAIREANGVLPIPDDRQAIRAWNAIVDALVASAATVTKDPIHSRRARYAAALYDLLTRARLGAAGESVLSAEADGDEASPNDLEAGWQAIHPLSVQISDEGTLAFSASALNRRAAEALGRPFDSALASTLLHDVGTGLTTRAAAAAAAGRVGLPASIGGTKLLTISPSSLARLQAIGDGNA